MLVGMGRPRGEGSTVLENLVRLPASCLFLWRSRDSHVEGVSMPLLRATAGDSFSVNEPPTGSDRLILYACPGTVRAEVPPTSVGDQIRDYIGLMSWK